MIDRFLSQTSFSSQEDFVKNLKIHVPDNFNFGYDIVDAWAAEQPDKPALLWTNDKGEHHQFSFADMKQYTDRTASYFQSLGIGPVSYTHLDVYKRQMLYDPTDPHNIKKEQERNNI